jgi:hypothetical protein
MSSRIRLAVMIAVPMGLVIVPGAAAAKSFTPKSIAGNYRGTWTNETYNTHGTFTVLFNASTNGKVLGIDATIGGHGFGCSSVPGFPPVALSKGSGPNHWNSTGFHLTETGLSGSVNATYSYSTGALHATGKAPNSCAPGVTYSITGHLGGGKLTGTATIHLTGATATTRFTATK